MRIVFAAKKKEKKKKIKFSIPRGRTREHFRQLASFPDYGIRLCERILVRWRAISAGATARSGPNAIISGDKPAKVKWSIYYAVVRERGNKIWRARYFIPCQETPAREESWLSRTKRKSLGIRTHFVHSLPSRRLLGENKTVRFKRHVSHMWVDSLWKTS